MTASYCVLDAWEYIQSIRDVIRDLENRIHLAKQNVDKMEEIMSGWSKQPLYKRKEDKKETLLNLEDREANKETRYQMVRTGAEKIHTLLKENLEYFKADPDSETWHNYIEYIDDIVLDGLFNCIQCSMQYFLNNTVRDKAGMPPLLEVKLELQSPDMVFEPSLDQDVSEGFHSLIEDLLDDIFKFASLVPRVAVHKGQNDYLAEAEELEDLLDMKEEIVSRVTAATDKAIDFRNTYESYAYLWVDDRQEFMSQFLKYGHVLTTEEVEQAGDEGVPESPPTLDKFKEQVDSYEKVYGEVTKFEV